MLIYIALVFSTLALVLEIAGVSLDDWMYWSVSVEGLTATIKFGLWKCCTMIPPLSSVCIPLEDIESPLSLKIKVGRGCEVTSLLMIVMSTGVVLATKYCFRKKKKLLLNISALLVGLAGALIIVGVVVFTVGNSIQKYMEENAFRGQVIMKPHTGFVLSVTSGILCFVAAVLYHIEHCFRTNQVRNEPS